MPGSREKLDAVYEPGAGPNLRRGIQAEIRLDLEARGPGARPSLWQRSLSRPSESGPPMKPPSGTWQRRTLTFHFCGGARYDVTRSEIHLENKIDPDYPIFPNERNLV